MKPANFEYIAPSSAEEAVAALARYEGDARLLAGGQSLIPLLNFRVGRPAALIDLGRCPDLRYIRREDDWIAIGPMTSQWTAEHSPIVAEACPLLRQALHYLGPATIRHRGTIGGTMAHADRVAELPAVAVALDAEFVALGVGGRRRISADDFFLSDLCTALEPDEMLYEVRFPVSPPGSVSAFVETGNRHHDLAIVGIAAQLALDPDGRCRTARLAAMGLGPRPVRLRQAEASLKGSPLDGPAIAEAARLSLQDAEPEDDVHASARYRRRVTGGLVERALNAALRGGEGSAI